MSEWVALYSNSVPIRYVATDVRSASQRADHLAPRRSTVVAIFTLDEWQQASARIMAGYVSTVETAEVPR